MKKRKPYHKNINWDEQPLGIVSDYELGKILGVNSSTARKARIARGIKAYEKPPRKDSLIEKLFECLECFRKFSTLKGLDQHSKRTHSINLNTEEYYLKINNLSSPPVCVCGCGGKPTFLGFTKGYRQYFKDSCVFNVYDNPHIYRTKETFKKQGETKKKKYQSGEWIPWQTGLTKETSKSLRISGEKGSATISNNPVELEIRSNRMKRNRLNGIIPTLKGANHPQWNGGSTSIGGRAKTHRKLYQEWKFPLLVKSNFSCESCGGKNSLEIHHDKERMCEIVSKFINLMNPDLIEDYELNTHIVETIVEYHIQNNVSGKVLCKNCHMMEHPSYNLKINKDESIIPK